MKPEVWLPVAICAASFLGTLSVVVVGFLYNNSRISDLRGDINERFHNLDHKFDNLDHRFDDLDHRFDDLEKLFDTKLLRVEGVLDARMSRIEDMLSHR